MQLQALLVAHDENENFGIFLFHLLNKFFLKIIKKF
jgi:hypothetical protein